MGSGIKTVSLSVAKRQNGNDFMRVLMKPACDAEPDASLLALIPLGDDYAMAAVYDRHCTLVYSIACRILADPLLAEDCIHEVFMSLWRTPDDFTNKPRGLQSALALHTCEMAVALRNAKALAAQ
jgi:hypothetical protein